ncbi:hypothetical protein BV210_17790 (plasmid) [Halorientalis sp. IM1011]|uniref:hypothetical protein n=1 Tax=Halorientalis sp. IM1011 TaxID=1932360 RepID=UPI00097CCAC3|nr:hypothetical protein [Halorientalis sp. IM1011]AQL44623.1 hypothetical protein BV210_17790 [Halorientalis sp. IM1011]
MGELRAPFGIDIATTLVGSGVTLLFSGLLLRYGHRFGQFTNGEMYLYAGGALFVVGLVLGIVFAIARID